MNNMKARTGRSLGHFYENIGQLAHKIIPQHRKARATQTSWTPYEIDYAEEKDFTVLFYDQARLKSWEDMKNKENQTEV
jgi:hypothetical protein